ncbi:MAG: TonB family protein [candidate division Zixibacteria bacterium]|nr:TonB family protein [candidate division Zixibacteria bacterium]
MAMNNAIYSPYGAFELKSKYQRNLLFGTLSVLSFIVVILLVFWIIANVGEEEIIAGPAVVIKTVADLGPPPSVSKRPPQVKVDQPNVAMPKVGIPKPVADEEVLDEDVVIASREELAAIVAPDIVASEGGGDIVVDIAEDDFLPAPTDFIPVEIYPEMISQHKPEYPRLAKQAGITGLVWVSSLVNEEGEVLKAIVGKTSGVTSLDEAAVKAAYKCRFKPGIQNGRPVKVWVTYKVEFELTDG